MRAISMPTLLCIAVEVHTFWPVTMPLVAVLDRPRGEAREVGTGAGLGEQLAPRVLAVEDAEQVFLVLTLVAVRDDRRRGEQVAETGGRTDRAVLR